MFLKLIFGVEVATGEDDTGDITRSDVLMEVLLFGDVPKGTGDNMSPACISFGFLFFFRLLLINCPDSCEVDWWPILVSLSDEAFRYGSKGLVVFMLNTKSQLPQVIS